MGDQGSPGVLAEFDVEGIRKEGMKVAQAREEVEDREAQGEGEVRKLPGRFAAEPPEEDDSCAGEDDSFGAGEG